jgi:hypothetical protein
MLKKAFEIKDKKIINDMLFNALYGTLAICKDNKPYSLPINFAQDNDVLYFHGSLKGRKIDILNNNKFASLSVVENYSLIDSHFNSNSALACPASQFFKSIIIDGEIAFVKDYEEKVKALSIIMKKLQKETTYKPLSEDVYQKAINATSIYKLIPNQIKAKFKFGQNITQERFDMIIKNLEQRAEKKDLETIKLMKELRA